MDKVWGGRLALQASCRLGCPDLSSGSALDSSFLLLHTQRGASDTSDSPVPAMQGRTPACFGGSWLSPGPAKAFEGTGE